MKQWHHIQALVSSIALLNVSSMNLKEREACTTCFIQIKSFSLNLWQFLSIAESLAFFLAA
jgi:hypothetical protein